MKIVQLTDAHISHENTNTFGVDVRQNFLDILKAVRTIAPDFIVLTGDLCFDKADPQIYRWIKSHLDFLKIPCIAIGGNHDDSVTLAGVFEMEHLLVADELYFKRMLGSDCVLFLDTSTGIVSDTQLKWLDHELGLLEKDTVIFMHHPPLPGGVPYMDTNYPLQNMEDVQKILFDFRHHLSIFCGHYHVEKTLAIRNITVHITPSTYFQIDWRTDGFKVDHLRIALNEIQLRKDGVVDSTVVYFDGNKI
jgi:3',5'-cyclic-AMP phosphodiesterase